MLHLLDSTQKLYFFNAQGQFVPSLLKKNVNMEVKLSLFKQQLVFQGCIQKQRWAESHLWFAST